MTTRAILSRLKRGPATNADLQEAACDHGGGIARTVAALRQQGKVRRVDGKSGRGKPAVYALTENANG